MVLDPSLQTCKYYPPPKRLRKKQALNQQTKVNKWKLQHSPEKKKEGGGGV